MGLTIRQDQFGGVGHGLDLTQLHPTSRLVSELTGLVVQRNKAVQDAYLGEAPDLFA